MFDSEVAMLDNSMSEIWVEDKIFLARLAIPLIFNQLGLVLSSRLQEEQHVPTPSLGQISPPYPLPSTKLISLTPP